MEKKYELPDKYNGILIQLAIIGMQDLNKLGQIKNDAIAATTKHFNILFDEVNSLIGGTKFQYSKTELPIVSFFYEHIGKMLSSRK